MATSPNIMLSNNPAVVDGGTFGTEILGNGITIDPSPGETTIVGTVNLDAVVVDGADVNGNLTLAGDLAFIGANRRITSDNTLAFQNTTTNRGSIITLLANGTPTSGGTGIVSWANSDTANSAGFYLTVDSVTALTELNSFKTGTGTQLPIAFTINGTRGLVIDTSANTVLGGTAALSTSATTRFLYLNSMAGTPSGVPVTPTGYSGKTAITVDTTNNKLYFYSNSAWRAIGSNTSGTATLVAGTVTVSTSAAKTASVILISRNTPGGVTGFLSAPSASIVDSTSFVINSDINTDTSTVNWMIIG